MFHSLKPYQKENMDYNPKVRWSLENSQLQVVFKASSKNWYTNPSLDIKTPSHWGLWEHDVFEIFLQKRTHHDDWQNRYYEFQVSPLGQSFILKIFKPRELYSTPLFDYEFRSKIQGNEWEAAFCLDLNTLEEEGELFGNFHSILGERRNHFSYELSQKEGPDFHLPKRFIKL